MVVSDLAVSLVLIQVGNGGIFKYILIYMGGSVMYFMEILYVYTLVLTQRG